MRGNMSAEFDYELTPEQWEALRAIRVPGPRALNRPVLEQLVALQLAARDGDLAVITPKGRKVLIRGSSRLLDLAS
jgi:hypothetical protein